MSRTLHAIAAALALPAVAQAQELAGFRIPYDDFVLFDADGDPATTGDQVTLTGQIGLDLVPIACSNLDPTAACDHTLEVGGELVGLASFRVDANVQAGVDELFVTDPGLVPIPLLAFPLGGLEMTISLRFLGALQVNGQVEAGTTFDVALEAPFEAGFETGPGFAFDADLPDPGALITSTPELEGGVSSTFTVGALAAVEFQVAIEGIPLPSPSFLFGPTATLHVDPFGDPWWSLDGSLALYGAFGILPGFLVPPTLLTSVPLGGLDAGGAIGDPGQQVDTRWAKAIDFGSHEEVAFLLPHATDPQRTLVGMDDAFGVFELDAEGAVSDAWRWNGARPLAAAHSATDQANGTRILGAVGSDLWFGDWLGGGSFGTSKRLEFFELDDWRWFVADHILALPDGDFVMGGSTSVAGNENRRTLMRVDPAGNVVWVNMYGPGYLSDSLEDMILTSDGAIVVVGRYEVPGVLVGPVVTKLATDGSVLWSRVVEDSPGTVRTATTIAEGPGGELLVMGHRGIGVTVPDPDLTIFTRIYDPVTGASDTELYHGSFVGDVALYGASVRDRALDVVATSSGYAMVGLCSEQVEEDAWIWTLGADQSLVDVAVYDSASYDALRRLRTMPDGGLLAAGDSRGFGGAFASDVFVVKTGSGPLVELDTSHGMVSLPHAFGTIAQGQGANPVAVSVTPLLPVSSDYEVWGLTEPVVAVTDVEAP